MEHTFAATPLVTGRAVTAFLRKWGPLLVSAIVLPGGIFIALFVWLRRRKQMRATAAGIAPAVRAVHGDRVPAVAPRNRMRTLSSRRMFPRQPAAPRRTARPRLTVPGPAQ